MTNVAQTQIFPCILFLVRKFWHFGYSSSVELAKKAASFVELAKNDEVGFGIASFVIHCTFNRS